MDIYSEYKFAFSARSASAQTTIHGWYRMTYPLPWYSTSIASDQGTNLTVNEKRKNPQEGKKQMQRPKAYTEAEAEKVIVYLVTVKYQGLVIMQMLVGE